MLLESARHSLILEVRPWNPVTTFCLACYFVLIHLASVYNNSSTSVHVAVVINSYQVLGSIVRLAHCSAIEGIRFNKISTSIKVALNTVGIHYTCTYMYVHYHSKKKVKYNQGRIKPPKVARGHTTHL